CSEPGRRSDVRVSFADGCCAAYIGRTSLLPDVRDGPSVFLQGVTHYQNAKAQQLVMHELLHALGLNHAHQSPDSVCEPEFIKEKVLRAYRWTEAEFRTNLKQLDHDSRSYTWSSYDSSSIMKYFFDPDFLKNREQSPCYSAENYLPSDRDYEGLRDAYPKPPRITPARSRQILHMDVPGPQSVKDLVSQLNQLEGQGE